MPMPSCRAFPMGLLCPIEERKPHQFDQGKRVIARKYFLKQDSRAPSSWLCMGDVPFKNQRLSSVVSLECSLLTGTAMSERRQ